ncbi:hypothetical protein DACRYDRAFT_19592 [Dacryopinax primogenitus]|uniref:BRCT domain-containing protein n=1 Tax=Dacryopinax primogenitus (strain DJM 731) TaxID=1858805 RepID=M5GH11_DACPD|nr:uncharacterized protein DACRYDRAFT_19592 [Dacryopinax primogenitus]EJU06428.1 hypothetical protein DACRYDRAFT_19592 [Dacryopinax primogenitus]
MDKYLYRTKPGGARGAFNSNIGEKRQALRFNPFAPPIGAKTDKERRREAAQGKARADKLLAPVRATVESRSKPDKHAIIDVGPPPGPLQKALRNQILNSLSSESNPITHSTAYERCEPTSSAATGHQRSDGRRSQLYFKSRNIKLREQAKERGHENEVFHGCVVYINGYMNGTTDLEVKRIVGLGGGRVRYMAGGGTTHIITSMPLSASKTHTHLNTNERKVHVVTPEWILDSVKMKKRQPEWKYKIVESKVQGSLGFGVKDNTVIDLTEE